MADGVILPFKPQHRGFRRPCSSGLLPGRLIAGVPQDDEACEIVLDLPDGALSSPGTSRGAWTRSAAANVIYWVARKTHAHPQLPATLPGTELDLLSSIYELAAIGLSVHTARLLDEGGWGQPHNEQRTVAASIGLGERLQGLSATFSDLDGEFHDIELYRNGSAWAETAERLDHVLRVLAQHVCDRDPIALRPACRDAPLVTLGRAVAKR